MFISSCDALPAEPTTLEVAELVVIVIAYAYVCVCLPVSFNLATTIIV
jgi:hypothetical protein